MLCRWTTSTRNVAHIPPMNAGHVSSLPAREFERPHRAAVLMGLDLPAVADGDRQMMAIPVARSIDQRTRVMLGAAAVAMNDVQHAVGRPSRWSLGIAC